MVPAKQERLGKPLGGGLDDIGDRDPEPVAVSPNSLPNAPASTGVVITSTSRMSVSISVDNG